MTLQFPHPAFAIAADAIDHTLIPQRVLATGCRMPAIGLGTFGSDHVSAGEIASAVVEAASIGYRHFDCAAVYGNEHLIGQALTCIQDGGIPREELWITSKLWNDMHDPANVRQAFEKSLSDLNLEYLDLYLIHWPFPNYHTPGCEVSSRSPDAKPYIHDNFMRTWRELEKLIDEGLVRNIGTSNMTIPKLELLMRDARIKPAVNEMEMHPHFQQTALYEYLQRMNIAAIAYCPIGSPNRPMRDRTPEDTIDIEDPVILTIAANHGVHPVTVCLKWAIQRGATPIPMSTKRKNFYANLMAAITTPLSGEEMAAIAKIDRNCRLIKGQVFLWKENQSWEDLWDINGIIVY